MKRILLAVLAMAFSVPALANHLDLYDYECSVGHYVNGVPAATAKGVFKQTADGEDAIQIPITDFLINVQSAWKADARRGLSSGAWRKDGKDAWLGSVILYEPVEELHHYFALEGNREFLSLSCTRLAKRS